MARTEKRGLQGEKQEIVRKKINVSHLFFFTLTRHCKNYSHPEVLGVFHIDLNCGEEGGSSESKHDSSEGRKTFVPPEEAIAAAAAAAGECRLVETARVVVIALLLLLRRLAALQIPRPPNVVLDLDHNKDDCGSCAHKGHDADQPENRETEDSFLLRTG